MKYVPLLLVVLSFMLLCSSVQAQFKLPNLSILEGNPPSLLMAQAEVIADKALPGLLGKSHFYCVSATLVVGDSPKTNAISGSWHWLFGYVSKNSSTLFYIDVRTDGKVRLRKSPLQFS